MDEMKARNALLETNETDVLSQIVDAMLAVRSDLQDATIDEWTNTLVRSCRRQKQLADDLRDSLASTC